MGIKRKICIAAGLLMLLAAALYLVLLMPQNARDEQGRMQQPAETAVEETAEVEISEQQKKETDLPDIDIDSWEYVLVNAEHSIGEYAPELGEFEHTINFASLFDVSIRDSADDDDDIIVFTPSIEFKLELKSDEAASSKYD